MLISRSLGRKLTATVAVAIGFVLMYEATVMDFRDIPRLVTNPSAAEDVALPAQATHLRYTATAYCKGHTTASGVAVRTGIAAADPDLLPVGSVIQIDNTVEQYKGIWTIMDTGPKVHGRHVDLYVWSCHEALAFGRRPVQVSVLRLGWSPRNSTPSLIKSLFRQNEETLPPPPVWPPVATKT